MSAETLTDRPVQTTAPAAVPTTQTQTQTQTQTLRPVRAARPSRLRRTWLVYLVAGGAVCLGHGLVPDRLARDLVYVAVGLSSAVAVLAGLRLNRPVRRAPWVLMGVGTLLWTTADAVGAWEADVAHLERVPSASDPPYLLGYASMIVALVALIRRRRLRGDRTGVIDSAVVTVGLGLLAWVLLVRPAYLGAAGSGGIADGWAAVVYPLADVSMIALLVALVGIPGGRTPALRLLLLALTLLITADALATGLDRLTWAGSEGFDALWLASYVVWGAAALHPSMYWLSSPPGPRRTSFTRARLVAQSLALLVAPATLAVQQLRGGHVDLWAGIGAATVMFLLVVVRMKIVIDELTAAHRAQLQLRDHLAHQAAHDVLTGLPNRAQALRLIAGALSRARRGGSLIAVLFVDLDGFKTVNDTYGHRSGDEVLQVLARRMSQEVRAGDVVARLGGDEFVVLLEPAVDETSAVAVGERLVAVAARPVPLSDGESARVGASVGVAVSQDGTVEPETVLHEADVAAYRAKRLGRGRVEVFDRGVRLELARRTDTEQGLVRALGGDELRLQYQPVVHLGSGTVTGFEALVRWDRPGVGRVPPGEFLPVAEQSELVCDLDTWVLHAALRQLADWNRQRGDTTLTMAVNVSGRHVARARVRTDVSSALEATGVAAHQLVVELTETALGDDVAALANLVALRELGLTVSIDDFGTGYNSIARLQRLPVDAVKIDRSFVAAGDPGTRALLDLMVHAAHAFGLTVVAEGVERQDQLETLRALGCESAQGFWLGRPQDPSDLDVVGADRVGGEGRSLYGEAFSTSVLTRAPVSNPNPNPRRP